MEIGGVDGHVVYTMEREYSVVGIMFVHTGIRGSIHAHEGNSKQAR